MDPAPTDYVVRHTRQTAVGDVTYAVVDMAGRLVHVTVPHRYTLTEHVDPIIRHALGARAKTIPLP